MHRRWSRADRRSLLCSSGEFHTNERLDWRAVLRNPDLLRFFRLHRYGHRRCPATRVPIAEQLPVSLLCPERLGFLAALAHQSFKLVARLSLHSTRRKLRLARVCLTLCLCHNAVLLTMVLSGFGFLNVGWRALLSATYLLRVQLFI